LNPSWTREEAARIVPLLNGRDAGAEYFKPQVKHLLVQTETNEATQFYIHLRVNSVVRYIDSLYASIEELKEWKKTGLLPELVVTSFQYKKLTSSGVSTLPSSSKRNVLHKTSLE